MFRAGQKVVCVDDGTDCPCCRGQLHKGEVYTIEGFGDKANVKGVRGLLLAEVVSDETAFHLPGWHPNRFRPAVERKTDISIIFTAMLTDVRADELARLTRDLEQALEPLVRLRDDRTKRSIGQ